MDTTFKSNERSFLHYNWQPTRKLLRENNEEETTVITVRHGTESACRIKLPNNKIAKTSFLDA